ncbi:hypothetical protein V1264_012422 [Littorina saxatilis]|uniref:Secreted protein n=1 Tax=Littorina saxatilis TaxID=31220 RepID=A0AAN9BWE5_9CAEN
MLPERIFVADFMLLLLLLLLVLLTPTTKKNTNKVVVVLLMLQQFAGQPVRTMGGAWPRTCATADTDFTDPVARSANLEDGSSFEGILPVVCVIAYRVKVTDQTYSHTGVPFTSIVFDTVTANQRFEFPFL